LMILRGVNGSALLFIRSNRMSDSWLLMKTLYSNPLFLYILVFLGVHYSFVTSVHNVCRPKLKESV
jgi:hypothetical protein